MTLYFVKRNGIDVEVVQGLFELVLKKTGLEQPLIILNELFEMLLAQVSSYAVFVAIKNQIDLILSQVISFCARFST